MTTTIAATTARTAVWLSVLLRWTRWFFIQMFRLGSALRYHLVPLPLHPVTEREQQP